MTAVARCDPGTSLRNQSLSGVNEKRFCSSSAKNPKDAELDRKR
jgi:hypothetical protein